MEIIMNSPLVATSSASCWKRLALLLMLLLSLSPARLARAQDKPEQKQEKPVAEVGGEKLYETDYLPRIQSQVQKLRMQEYDLRLRALKDAINKKLLKVEAAKKGISEEEWLRPEIASKVPEASQEEIEQEFVQQMFQGGDQPAGSMEEAGKQLQRDRILEARDEYFEALREKAGVKIYLLPPT